MNRQERIEKIKDAEQRLLKLAKELGDLNRLAVSKKQTSEALHAESQFYRRLREFANRELGEIEGVMLDPNHYSR